MFTYNNCCFFYIYSTIAGNRKLLWHGSRLTNFVGILSQGLRIAPPEAPKSGYRFGKGIYFADMCGLSAMYCRTAGSQDFCMLLADVALGEPAKLTTDQYMEKPLPRTNSTFATGSQAPGYLPASQASELCVFFLSIHERV